jgi:hypothetical protein
MYDLLPDRIERHRDRAARVIKELFNIEVNASALTEDTTLFDFADDGADDPQFSRLWGECLKQEIFVRYGITCEAHEPLVDLLARLECAERGVRIAHAD